MPKTQLQVQEYLANETLEQLTDELGIIVKQHDTLPLVILNYNQIESPKLNPIVRECRGLVLRSDTFELVARSFFRFFNWGEVMEEMSAFDFSDFSVMSKEDGSLVLLYYFDGHWRANTRGSFATDNMSHQQFTWAEGICKAFGVSDLDMLDEGLDRSVTYVCEFVSPWNKVVRRYDTAKMYLLSAFRGFDELPQDEIDRMDLKMFVRPKKYDFSSIEEIQAFLEQQAADDPTFEGVVICDKHRNRWKIKSATYLGLHRLRGEGDNLFHPKHLLPFILTGEDDELLTYYGEVAEQFFRLKSQVYDDYIKLLEVWADHRDIPDQKDYALAIKGKTPFESVLFTTRRKYGKGQKAADLRQEFRSAESLILKRLMKT